MMRHRLLSGLRSLFNRARFERELDEDLREYVRMAAARNVAAGMSPDAALREARAQVGGMEAIKDRVRDVGWESVADSLLQDVRYGVRMLTRNPGFTAVAVLALALGIGINTAVFTAYKAVVLRQLDARNPDEMMNTALNRPSGATYAFSYPDYEAYRDGVHAFSGLVAFFPEQRMTLSSAGDIVSQRNGLAQSRLGRLIGPASGGRNAEFASTFVVSENFFRVFGVAAVRGRTFDAIDPRELIASPPVLISENYWQRRFAADPAIIGRTVRLNGAAVTVIGITPRDFVGTGVAAPNFWLPLTLAPLVYADDNWLRNRENERCRLFGRLAPGATIAQAQAEMNLVANRLRTQHDPRSESAKPATALVWPGSTFPLPLEMYPGGMKLGALLLMAAAAMVLAVACANVGSLQLARSRSRQSELHTRLSLGASRRRVIRQLLTESALLGLLAGATALLFTWMLLEALMALLADVLPLEIGAIVFDVTPDVRIFLFVCAISLGAGIVFGLAPAFESSRAALTSSGRSGTPSTRSRRIQDALVAAQVMLSVVLLIAGSLMIRSSIRLTAIDPGYQTTRLVDLDVTFPAASRYGTERKQAFVRELRSRIAALPGVVAVTSGRPPGNLFRTPAVSLEGTRTILHYGYVQANYFETLGIPVSLGRTFQPGAARAEGPIVLSESAAKQLWPQQNPVGRSLRLGLVDEGFHRLRDMPADGSAHQVIGVVHDTRGGELDGSDAMHVYLLLPDDQLPARPILVRTAAEPADATKAIDALVSSMDPDLLATARTLEDLRRQSPAVGVSRTAAGVASSLGLLGLLLALMGIYGTVSYIVALRTREVGIRIAIGAQRGDILALILRESTRPVIAGLVAGMLLAAGVSSLMRGVLYGLDTVDSVSFAGVSLLFLVVALLAAYGPSRRAVRVDPVVALRYE